MVDNVIVRCHGCNQPRLKTETEIQNYKNGYPSMYVPEHYELYKKIMQYKGKSFSMQKIYNQTQTQESELTSDDFLITKTSKKLNSHYLTLDKISFVSDKEVKDRNLKVNGKYRVPSSEHDVVYSVNIDAGYVEFNINIPKYLYGHNLAQFIPQKGSYCFNFQKGDFNTWETQTHYLYDRIYSFIDGFFTDLFLKFELEFMPNYEYIELNRIDLCYNQFFKTKTQALMYLDEQKKIHKKRSRSKNRLIQDFESSITYHTSNGSYFKIYHKGSEYINVKHGDFKKHEQINKSFIDKKYKNSSNDVLKNNEKITFAKFRADIMGVPFVLPDDYNVKNFVNNVYKDIPINTMFLKNEMDKVLRYEISISGKSLARIYKKNNFRSHCPFHNQAIRTHKKVRKLDKRKSKKIKTQTITKQERETSKKVARFLNNGCYILLTQNKKFRKHATSGKYDYNSKTGHYKIKKLYEFLEKGTLLETRDIGFFTKSFLSKLIKDFRTQIEYYQIEELEPFDDLVKKVREYNKAAERKKKIYDDVNESEIYDLQNYYDKQGRLQKKRVNKTKGNKIITKASQLLTEKQKMEKNIQKINISNVTEIFRLMHEKKMSPSQIQKFLKLTKSSFYRRMSYLKILGVKEQTLFTNVKIKVRTDFLEYYYLTSGTNYIKDFFLKKEHIKINSKSI